MPLQGAITGWSPFEPGDTDNASLPVAALEYRFTNPTAAPIEDVFSWNAKNFMAIGGNAQAVRPAPAGFVLWGGPGKDKPHEEGALSATVDDPAVQVNHAWFRGGWWDPLTMAGKDVAEGACYDRAPVTEGGASPGASLFVPFQLAASASKTIVLRLAWFVGQTNLRYGGSSSHACSHWMRSSTEKEHQVRQACTSLVISNFHPSLFDQLVQ